jgi:deoxyribose-phosphate aldolase
MVKLPSVAEIAQQIDHAILKPDYTRNEVIEELRLAKELKLFSVCVRPSDVYFASRYLANSSVKVGTVIGFPHGASKVKLDETLKAYKEGADEFDMVIDIGALKSGFLEKVEDEFMEVRAAARTKVVKVILETCLLSAEEIVTACQLASKAGMDFVKTSTGFSTDGATVEAVGLMKASIAPPVEVKASGGIRDLATLLKFRGLGCTRFGTSASATILGELEARLAGEEFSPSSEINIY